MTGVQTCALPICDLVEGKKTMMVLFALEKANSEDHDRLIELLQANDEAIIPEAMELLNKYGAIDHARLAAYDHVIRAKEALSVLPDSDAKEVLFKLADSPPKAHMYPEKTKSWIT